MKKIILLFIAVVLLGGAHLVSTMAPDVQAVLVGVSHGELHDAHAATPAATGAGTVGVGDAVYIGLKTDDEILSADYTVTGPAGSVATLTEVAELGLMMFQPDQLGIYTVSVTVNTPDGSAMSSVIVVAAEYVGVGNVGGATPNFGLGQCAGCHPGNTASWGETGHATMFQRGVDGIVSSHYASYCIGCHTVGFNTDPAAVNGGFDDVMADNNWPFPDHPGAGEWDALVADFPAVAAKGNIQCENCHGPGSLHKGDKTKTTVSVEASICGYCHDEMWRHENNFEWKQSGHGMATMGTYASERSYCQPCHSVYGFINAMDPASDLDQTYGNPQITCVACHDPHVSEGTIYQLRAIEVEGAGKNADSHVEVVSTVELGNGYVVSDGGTGQLCMNCHKGRRNAPEYVDGRVSSHFGPHYSNQADLLYGTNAITFNRYVPSSTHMDVLENACVDCHMYEFTQNSDDPVMFGGHTFKMSDDVDGDNVEACVGCHGAMDSFHDIKARVDHDGDGTIEGAVDEVDGLMHELGVLLPPYGDPEVSPGDLDGPIERRAGFNWRYIYQDHSHGLHNFQFAVGILKLAIEALTDGLLVAGEITSVMDVPNDQGKQVNVAWSRFGGDGVTDDPIQTYHVWRLVDAMGKVPVTPDFETIDTVPVDKSVDGSTVAFDGQMWTAVGMQPAAIMDMYSAVVPTLGDSTAAGVYESTFMVTGHTALSQVYVSTAPATGYSIDNLVPTMPASLDARLADNTVTLTWQTNDPDINYYAIYRSTTSGFDPSTMEPIATSTETEYVDASITPGTTYYYVVVAYDFSGNMGVFSGEVVPRVVTGIEATGMPDQYALLPNYPNPFNPTTQIEFSVPEATDVRVTIFNVSGKEVDVLVDSHISAGNYQMTWNAGNLASGVYFCRMETAAFVSTNTMLLLK